MDEKELKAILIMFLEQAYPEPFTPKRELFPIMDNTMKKTLLEFALNKANGNKKRAAQICGVNRNTFRKWEK